MKLVVESFDQLTQAYDEKVEENYLREVLDEVTLIPNLNKQQWTKALKCKISGDSSLPTR